MHLSKLFKKALYFAAEKHDGQYRKGGKTPYIVHPIQVAFGVRKYTKDEKIIIAALLHDTHEDCKNVSLSDLKKEFGESIAGLVKEISFVDNKKYSTWKKKKEVYLEKVKLVSKEALLIIAVDKLCNMQAYFGALEDKKEIKNLFGGTPRDYIWYYKSVGDILELSTLKNHRITKDYFRKIKAISKIESINK
ncbi:MAG: HD domain-containing protein [bacterium]